MRNCPENSFIKIYLEISEKNVDSENSKSYIFAENTAENFKIKISENSC